MTVIVTGGAGFIGLNFIFHMLKAHLEGRIVCLDKLTYVGNLSTPKGEKIVQISASWRWISVVGKRSMGSSKRSIRMWS